MGFHPVFSLMGLREFGVMRFVSCVDSFDEMSHRGGNGGKDPMTEAPPLFYISEEPPCLSCSFS